MATIATVQVLVDGEDDQSTSLVLKALRTAAKAVPGVLAMRITDASGIVIAHQTESQPPAARPDAVWEHEAHFVVPLETTLSLDPRETGRLRVVVPCTDGHGARVDLELDVNAQGVKACLSGASIEGMVPLRRTIEMTFEESANGLTSTPLDSNGQVPASRLVLASTGEPIVGLAYAVPAVAKFESFSVGSDGWIRPVGARLFETFEHAAFPLRQNLPGGTSQLFYDAQMRLVPTGALTVRKEGG